MKEVASAVIGQPITRLTVNPRDNHKLIITGNGFCKQLKVSESSVFTDDPFRKLN